MEPLSQAAMKLNYERARRLITDFAAAAEPLSFDPHWNRFWAILWEAAEADLEGELDHWRQYVDDLEQLAALSPDDRRRRQAIVWRRMAQTVEKTASRPSSFAIEDEQDDEDEQDRPDSQERKRAVDYLDRSIQLDPSQRSLARPGPGVAGRVGSAAAGHGGGEPAARSLSRRYRGARLHNWAPFERRRTGSRIALYRAGSRT